MAITTLSGASSSDYTTLLGTELADTFALDTDKVHVEGLEGGDTVTAANTLVDVKVYGGAAADTVSFSGAIEKGFLSLQAGNDSFTVSKEFQGEIYAGKGVDSLTFTKNVSSSTIKSDNGNDTITASADVIGSLINSKTDDDKITISGDLNTSSVYGGKQADTISVNDVTSSIVSGDKQRDKITINGDLSSATIKGGDDIDTITLASTVSSSTSSTVYGDAGNDVITNSSTVAVILDGGDDDDSITAKGAAKHTIFGGSGDDVIDATVGDLDVVLDGGVGDDSIVSSDGADSITGGAGDDTIASGVGKDTISSGAGEDIITLSDSDDYVTAGADNDEITFATAKQTIFGGKGDDSFIYNNVADLTFEDSLSGDAGSDVLELKAADASIADEDFQSVTSIETLAITGAAGAASYVHVLGAKAQTAGIRTVDMSDATTNLQKVDASAFTTGITLTASDANVNDSLEGGSGDDTFNSGADGAVVFKGNGGSDTFNITTSKTSTVDDLSGTDILKVASGAGAVTATVTADFTATGDSTNNLSLAGVTLVGSADAKITLTNAGNVFGYTVTGQAANVDVKGSSVVGSKKGDKITGGSGDGADTFTGGLGNDTITGNGGIDSLAGGSGDDTFVFTDDLAANDSISGGGDSGDNILIETNGNVTGEIDFDLVSGLLTINAGDTTSAGTLGLTFSEISDPTGQTVVVNAVAGSATTITNNANSSSTVFNITGNSATDTLKGSNGNDTLTGGAAADELTGGAGNDTLILNTGDASAKGSDVDIVHFNTAATNGIDTIIDYVKADVLDFGVEAAASAFNNNGTLAPKAITALDAAGAQHDNLLFVDVDSQQFDDAADLQASLAANFGRTLADGSTAKVLIIYGSSAATEESRIAVATVADAGGVTAATDVAIVKGMKAELASYTADGSDFLLT